MRCLNKKFSGASRDRQPTFACESHDPPGEAARKEKIKKGPPRGGAGAACPRSGSYTSPWRCYAGNQMTQKGHPNFMKLIAAARWTNHIPACRQRLQDRVRD